MSTSHRYRSLSALSLWRHGTRAERLTVFGLWGLMLLASVGLGLATVMARWSGVPLSFVASIFSSSGALIWWYTNGIDRTALLPIWQGWWLGGFLQSVFVVGPLMALLWPRIARWQARRPELLSAADGDTRRSVLRLLGVVTSGVLVYGFATIQLANSQLERAAIEGSGAVGDAVTVMQQTTWVFYWVFALIVLFFAFFGYQSFTHWQRAADQLLADLHRANRELDMLAHTDGLTGLLNRRAADERLHDEWHRAARLGTGAALVMLDIDHFKHINDRCGHAAGDAVIRSLAAAIRAESREMDIACRHGGEEFLLILPQADTAGARQFAERLRHRVAATAAQHEGQQITFTISLGLAVLGADDATAVAWLARADQALYRAKSAGRNRTEVAG